MQRLRALLVVVALTLPTRAFAAPGDLDSTFGTGGKVITSFGSVPAFQAKALVVQPDGKLVAGGSSVDAVSLHAVFALVRYNPDGSLDGTFENGGTVTTPIGSSTLTAEAFALALQANGRLVEAGSADFPDPTGEFALARYSSNSCPPVPQSCANAPSSELLINNSADDTQDTLTWKWIKGTATAQQFGNPTLNASYALCLYDVASSSLVGQGQYLAPASATNWSATAAGWKYHNATRLPDGLSSVKLRRIMPFVWKAVVKGDGATLSDPALPLPLAAQLINTTNGRCWGTTFNHNNVVINSADKFKATLP